MKYKIIIGKAEDVEREVTEYLNSGWELQGNLFQTGNKIHLKGDRLYPHLCDYTSELAQVIVKRD